MARKTVISNKVKAMAAEKPFTERTGAKVSAAKKAANAVKSDRKGKGKGGGNMGGMY